MRQHWHQVLQPRLRLSSGPSCFAALHVQKGEKGGIRKRHGGTLTPLGVRKGDWVEAVKAGRTVRGYVSGYTRTPKSQAISVTDAHWHRLGQFVVSQVRLLSRSTRLLVRNAGELLTGDVVQYPPEPGTGPPRCCPIATHFMKPTSRYFRRAVEYLPPHGKEPKDPDPHMFRDQNHGSMRPCH